MKQTNVVLVTGMSGAGKSTAMVVFENMKYYCIDNLPVELLTEFGELVKNHNYPRIALALSLDHATEAIRVLSNIDWISVKVVFLDCENEAIVKRYKFTRRSHPMLILNRASSLSEAIELERKIAEQVIAMADTVIDTTHLKTPRFQDVLEASFNIESVQTFRVVFESFGYKYGLPEDADLLLDVRFLPNPFYIESLRNKTGNDEDVYNYVMEQPETRAFLEKALRFYSYLLEQYELEGKNQVIFGIGCTGGQHRSVALTNYFADYYKQFYQIYKYHRDADH
ncbi:MAG: RNase adapter RapZ [Erysipelotrichaceae bacterium]|nr:RNase adapter RapZ [Erysipelotrichaceae bacterium]